MKTASGKTATAPTAPDATTAANAALANSATAKTAASKTASAKRAGRKASSARAGQESAGRARKRAAAAQPVSAAQPAQKVVRDGFTMPQADYDQLKALKASCLKRGVEVKKSELLRAGLQALTALSSKDLDARIRALTPVKAGRKKNKV